MRIKKEILDRLDISSINRIALALGRSAATVAAQIRLNKINGRLTKMDALTAISKEVGIAVDQLLEVVSEEVTA